MIGWVRAALVLSTLLFLPGLREDFETPKTAVVRICGLAALASAAASWRALRRVAWTALDVAVLAWLAVEALTTAFSSAPVLSLFGEPVQREGFATSLAIVGLYLGARLGTGDAASARRTLGLALFAATAASAYAILQAAGRDPIAWEPASVGGFATAVGRPFGTLGHPNLLGVVSAAAGAGWMVALARGGARGWRAIAVAGALVVCAGATAVTLSRAAWLGFAVGVATVVALAWAWRMRISAATVWASAVLSALVAAVLAGLGWGGRLAVRLAEMLHPTQGSGAARLEMWRSALSAWQDRPWLGWGPDTFAMIFPRYQTAAFWKYEWAAVPLHAHSIVLHTLATRGLAGVAVAIAWAWTLVHAARSALRRSPEASLPITVALVVPIAIAASGALGAVGITGHVLIAVASGTMAALASPPPEGTAHRGLSAASLVVCAGAALWASADLASSRLVAGADAGLRRAAVAPAGSATSLLDRSLGQVRRAAALTPFDDFVTRLRVDLLLLGAERGLGAHGKLIEATGEARRGLRLVPQRAENHAQLARALAYRVVLGDAASLTEAESEIELTVRLAPMSAMLLGECARLELLLGRPDLALPYARRSASLYPEDSASRLILERALIASGSPGVAPSRHPPEEKLEGRP